MLTRSMMLLLLTVMTCSLLNNNFQTTVATARAVDPNPLLAEWTGPYGGVPRFDLVKVELFKPALEAAMAENLAEVDKIAKDPAAPTFENTMVAMEKAGQLFDRVGTIYNVWQSTMSPAR
jgi:peptidyl-dipeptidase Dcp